MPLPKLAWLAFAGNPFEPLLPVDSERPVPKVLMGDLQRCEELGCGASGIIYRALWLARPSKMPEEVAVKVYRGAVTSDGYPHDELAVAMRVGAHANLVSSLAYIEDAAATALIMRLIPKGYKNLGLPPTLASCTRDTFTENLQLTLAQIENMIAQVESVLAHLRVRQVSHGDIYAHNILIDERAHLLLGDFGAAAYYGYLPESIQQALAAIEARALGYFIEDLLSLCINEDKQQPAFKHYQQKAVQYIG